MTSDEAFFAEYPDRNLRIRRPDGRESDKEFRTLGPHSIDRRRIIVVRVAPWLAQTYRLPFMKIPFLAFADDTIEDRDDVLAPILDGIMREARRGGAH